MTNYLCPFCNSSFPLLWNNTYKSYKSSFETSDLSEIARKLYSNTIQINFFKCPTCGKTSLNLKGINDDFKNISVPVYPNSLAKQFPNYIPKSIIEDYKEAYSIVNLSPKASATLSRRCIQSMIRDFWGINKPRLVDEIDELKAKIPSSQLSALNSLRSIGNIGAHPQKDINVILDIEDFEAEKLLKLIEFFIDKWYIARHDEEELLKEIQSIANDKKNQQISKSTASSNVS